MIKIHNYVIGAGGHSRSVLRQLKQKFPIDSINLIDLNSKKFENSIMGVKISKIKDIELIQNKDKVNIFCAIGDNEKRIYFLNKARALGFNTPILISESAIIDETSYIEEGTYIADLAFVGPQVKIGKDCIINTNSIIEHESLIGSGSHIAPNGTICGRCVIKNNVFIGANATVIDKIKISSNSIIGAGSLVIRDIISEDQTWLGIPAKLNEKS